MKKLRAGQIQGMLGIIHIPASYLKSYRLKYTKLYFCLLLYMGVRFGVSL
jgi:hypothetical protein